MCALNGYNKSQVRVEFNSIFRYSLHFLIAYLDTSIRPFHLTAFFCSIAKLFCPENIFFYYNKMIIRKIYPYLKFSKCSFQMDRKNDLSLISTDFIKKKNNQSQTLWHAHTNVRTQTHTQVRIHNTSIHHIYECKWKVRATNIQFKVCEWSNISGILVRNSSIDFTKKIGDSLTCINTERITINSFTFKIELLKRKYLKLNKKCQWKYFIT